MDRALVKKGFLVLLAIAGAGFLAWCLFMVAMLVVLFGFGGGQWG